MVSRSWRGESSAGKPIAEEAHVAELEQRIRELEAERDKKNPA
jgi:hypothetical protein